MIEESIVKPEEDKFQRLVLGVSYDKIETYEDIMIFTKDNHMFFKNIKTNYKSEVFDDIKIDEKNNLLVYCTLNDKTKIFLRSRDCFIAEMLKCNLRFLSIWEGIYYFACYENDNHEKLIGVNGKTGLVKILSDNKYFRISSIFSPAKKIFLFDKENDFSDVRSLDEGDMLKDIDFTFYNEKYKTLIYREGIMAEDKEGVLQLTNGFDSVVYLRKGIFKTRKKNAEGLWYAPYGEVLAPKDNNEFVTLPNSFETFNEDKVFVCGFVNKKKFNLIKIIDGKMVYKTINSYDKGEFLTGNLIVLKNRSNDSYKTYIFNKYGVKVLEFNQDVKVEYIYASGYRDYEVYKIAKDYYKYNGKKMYKINLKKEDMFIGEFRTDLADIIVNSYDKEELEKWRDYFNNIQNEKEINTVVRRLLKNND